MKEKTEEQSTKELMDKIYKESLIDKFENKIISKLSEKWKNMYYTIRRFVVGVSELPRNVMHLVQTIFRGYSDFDTWNMTSHLSKLILKRLKAFKKLEKSGIPCMVSEEGEPWENGVERWEEIIDKMIWSFEYDCGNRVFNEKYKYVIYDEDGSIQDFDKELEDKLEKRYHEGLELFAKYFDALWD